MPPHPLTNFKIQKYYENEPRFIVQKYYENEPRFIGVISRDNMLTKVKDWAYIINLDEYKDVATRWIASFCNRSEIVCFDNFGVEHLSEEIIEFVGNKI